MRKTETIKLNNSDLISLPVLIASRLLIQANSGGGKSYLIRRIAEQAHGKVQLIIIDLEGEFLTLREKFDFVLAGKGGDVEATSRTAAVLARKLLELNASAIIDLYELPGQERKHFVKLFLEAMVDAPKDLWHSCLVVVDEAHVFCPEKDQSEATGAVNDLLTRGRKRGFCAILATQRLSKLSKDSAAECNNVLIGRTSLDVDMKRAVDNLGFTTKEKMLSLRNLEPGEFYAYGPAISQEVKKVRVGNVMTTHPRAGSRIIKRTTQPTEKIKSVLAKMSDLPQEAEKEATTIAELKSEIIRLRREKRSLVQVKTDPQEIEKAIRAALLEQERKFDQQRSDWLKQIENWFRIIKEIGEAMNKSLADYKKQIPKKDYKFMGKYPVKVVESLPKKTFSLTKQDPPEVLVVSDGSELTNPEKRILNAVAWLESIGIEKPEQTAVAFLAGYKYGGGAFNNPRGSLRVKGLVEYHGNKIGLTSSGRQSAKIPEDTLTTEELHKKVLSVLRGPERKILEILLEIYPEEISNEDLAIRAGYAPGGGAYNNPRGRLRSLGLIEYNGSKVKARSILFL